MAFSVDVSFGSGSLADWDVILAVPRSCSTAFARGWASRCGASRCILEPINLTKRSVRDACQVVNRDLRERLVFKLMVSHVRRTLPSRAVRLGARLVLCIRPPRVQLRSMAALAHTERILGRRYRGRIEWPETDEDWNCVLREFRLSNKVAHSHWFPRTGWESLSSLRDLAREGRAVVVDGDDWRQDPEVVDCRVAEKLGRSLVRRPDAPWVTPVEYRNRSEVGSSWRENIWQLEAAASSGVTQSVGAFLGEELPDELEEFIGAVAQPVYRDFRAL